MVRNKPKNSIVTVILRLALAATVWLEGQPLIGQESCVALVQGPVAFDVDVCKPFDPAIFDTSKPRYKFIADLDPAGRQQLLESYRGLVVKGKVVLSRAKKEGISTTKGALQGETVIFFIPPGPASCDMIRKKRVSGAVSEKCCNGTGDVPCLLGSGLVLSDVKVLGQPEANASGEKTNTARKTRGQDYIEAEKKFLEKNYKEAAKLYEKADASGDMDVKGLFRLGQSYRELEKCDLATRPLKKIWERKQANKIWSDEELDARRGIFLLARCAAKNGDASGAVFYLNAFLLDPKKHRSELQLSLKHKDFGWIHTSKEYQQFKLDAERQLTKP
jgi:hypothetical protein